MGLRQWINRRYLTADLRALALGRIALALVLLLDLARRARGLDDWYTNAGLLPNHTVLWRPTFAWVFSLFFTASHRHEAALGFLLCGVAYLALLFGVRTKLAHVASLIAVLSLHGRVLFVQNGGDIVLGELTLWTAFLPTGKRYSVDALRERLAAAAFGGAASERPARRGSVTSLAVLALLLQLAAIYGLTALQKNGETWRNGSVVHYMLHQDCVVTSLGLWVRGWLTPFHSQVLTASVRLFEGMLPFLLLSPIAQRDTRLLAIGLVVLLHTGLGLLLTLGVFGLSMCAFTPNLLAKRDLDALERIFARLAASRRLSVDGLLARPWVGRLVRILGAPGAVESPDPGQTMRRKSWLSRLREVALGYLLLCGLLEALVDNRDVTHVPERVEPRFVKATAEYLQAKQGWSMYAPDVPTTDMNLSVDAVTVDHRHVDPWNEAASPSQPRPGLKIPPRLGQDALHYAYVLRLPWQEAYFPAFSDWILRYPERTGRPVDKIVSFEVFFVEDDSPPPGEREPRNPRQRSLFRYP